MDGLVTKKHFWLIAKEFGWMEDLCQSIDFTPEQAGKVRRQLWGMGNMLKVAGQNGT